MLSLRRIAVLVGLPLATCLFSTIGHAQRPSTDPPIDSDLEKKLSAMLVCGDNSVGQNSPCNRFFGRAMSEIFCSSEFGPNSQGSFLVANQIAAYVADPDNGWTHLGTATSQSALDSARVRSGDDYVVIAVKAENPKGHVAIVLPGPDAQSGKYKATWGTLWIPRSAAALLGSPAGSYVGRSLSSSWRDPSGVELYSRKPSGCGA
jgi:hypothetical protein